MAMNVFGELLAPQYLGWLWHGFWVTIGLSLCVCVAATLGGFALCVARLQGRGVVQWAAVVVHLRRRSWLPAAHTIAGAVMLGWIAGECLVLDSFQWMHALWGGIGAIQVLLVAALLGAFRPWEKLA